MVADTQGPQRGATEAQVDVHSALKGTPGLTRGCLSLLLFEGGPGLTKECLSLRLFEGEPRTDKGVSAIAAV